MKKDSPKTQPGHRNPAAKNNGHSPLVQSFGRTDCGLVRTSNQDHFLIAELARTLWVSQTSLPQPEIQYGNRRGHLYLIADGMGGHRGGEVASMITVKTVEQYMLDIFRKAEDFPTALKLAHARLLHEAAHHPEVSGMGTTLTMAVVNNWKLYVIHAGDSRCYLLRGGKLTQLTQDHTVVGELIRRGILQPEEAAHHNFRHVVTNVVGGVQKSVHVDVQEYDLEHNDALLLCTDGLTDMVENEDIQAILQTHQDPQLACDHLVDKALANGGRDNVTSIVVQFNAP
ncbi:MAG: Stp1/IreP family PP2C-type Ser/Thr phosphatase [Planctomycetaceae bacterium]|nr:Stp1/IreP family PP2C-type Ser/Thr phosphatase [Planctomycetaceae bacterium]